MDVFYETAGYSGLVSTKQTDRAGAGSRADSRIRPASGSPCDRLIRNTRPAYTPAIPYIAKAESAAESLLRA
jgi:hypothetical protein